MAERALTIHRETGYRLGKARAHVVLAHTGDKRTAHEHRTWAQVILTETEQELFPALGPDEKASS